MLAAPYVVLFAGSIAVLEYSARSTDVHLTSKSCIEELAGPAFTCKLGSDKKPGRLCKIVNPYQSMPESPCLHNVQAF